MEEEFRQTQESFKNISPQVQIREDGQIQIKMEESYYKPLIVDEVPEFEYIEQIPNLIASKHSVNVACQIFDEIMDRWEAYYYSKNILKTQMKQHLLTNASTQFISSCIRLQQTQFQYTDSPFQDQNDWLGDEEPIPAHLDVTMSFSRKVQFVKSQINNLQLTNDNISLPDIYSPNNENFHPTDLQFYEMLDNSKLTWGQSADTQRNKDSPQKLMKKTSSQILLKDLINNQGGFKTQRSNSRNSINLSRKESSLKFITLNEYYNRNMRNPTATSQEKDVESLIDWQRRKKLRDEQRHLELNLKAQQESQQINKQLNLDDGKTRFTFTHEGKLIIIDPIKLNFSNTIQKPLIKSISQGCMLLKKGVLKTNERILLDIDKSVQIKNITDNQLPPDEENIKYSLMQNPIDTFTPKDGVVYRERNKIRAGRSIEMKELELNKMSRTQYFNNSSIQELSILFDKNYNSKESQAGSEMNTSKLQTIHEQSMEYNNTSGFLHSLHNHLSGHKKNFKIQQNYSKQELTDLLIIDREEQSINLGEQNSNFQNTNDSKIYQPSNIDFGYQTSYSLPRIIQNNNTSKLIKNSSSRNRGGIFQFFQKSLSQSQFNNTFHSVQQIQNDDSQFIETASFLQPLSSQSKERIDTLNMDIIQDKNWGFNTARQSTSGLPQLQTNQLPLLEISKQRIIKQKLPKLSLDKAIYQSETKPFSPRLQRLLNKSYIEKIQLGRERMKTSRNNEDVQKKDSILMKKQILKTPGLLINQSVQIKKQ